MRETAQTNVVGIFDHAATAESAAVGLRTAGFGDDKVGVAHQEGRTLVTVVADGRHAEVVAHLESSGAHGVQTVAR